MFSEADGPSGQSRRFADRTDAGRRLAQRLTEYRGQDVLVLGIPRGGIPVAAEIARQLNAELDVMVARKIGAPTEPELAIGAVTATGGRYFNDEIVRELAVSEEYLDAAAARETAEAERQASRLRGGWPASVVKDRIVL